MPGANVIPITVGTTEVQIVRRDSERTSLTIQNTHATAVLYARFRMGVDASNGIAIYKEGHMSLVSPEDDPTQEVWAISDTATTLVRVYQGYGKK